MLLGNVLYQQCVRLKSAQPKPTAKLPQDLGSISAIRSMVTVFGSVFSSSIHKNLSEKVKHMVTRPSLLRLTEHQAHMHSFSHLNFSADTKLRDQQQGVAQTKHAGASEHRLFSEAPGSASPNTPGSPWLPAAHQAQAFPGWSPGRTTAVPTHEPSVSSLRYVVCVLWLSAVQGFGM